MSNEQFYITVLVPTLASLLGNAGIIVAISITNKRISRLEKTFDDLKAQITQKVVLG